MRLLLVLPERTAIWEAMGRQTASTVVAGSVLASCATEEIDELLFLAGTMPLAKYNIIAFATIVDVERSKRFYRDTLGLALVREEPPFALVFDANGIMIRLGMAKELPKAHGTVLGWQVPAMEVAVRELTDSGVHFERFEGLGQDEKGIWKAPTGARVAWFRDPDGNILSISEHPELEEASKNE